MELKVSKEWCLNMAKLESDEEIGAGIISYNPILYNPIFNDLLSKQAPLGEEFSKVLHDNIWDLYVKD